jgi:tRNA A37 N6-isopentenylltransferase MiaA
MKNMDWDIIIIKGAPSSGKSTTAKELAKYFSGGVRMEIDNLRSMVISVEWTNQKEHIEILNVSTHLINNFYDLNYKPIIVIDTFSGNKIIDYLERLNNMKKDWKISIFSLYVTESELKKRLDLRTDKFKDFDISKKINNDTIEFKLENEIQIDTTELTAKETSKLIYDYLENRTPGGNKGCNQFGLNGLGKRVGTQECS